MTQAGRQEAVLTSALVLSHLNPVSQLNLPGACGGEFGSYNRLRQVTSSSASYSRSTWNWHLAHTCVEILICGEREEALPGLLKWLRKRGRALTAFVSECGSPRTEAALSVLTSSALGLSTVIIHEASDYGLSVLSMFMSLARCELAGAGSDLDLGALQTLAGLNALHLCDGEFSNLDQLASLT